jgi:hypothetical protein
MSVICFAGVLRIPGWMLHFHRVIGGEGHGAVWRPLERR